MRTAFTQTLYDYVRRGKGRVVSLDRIHALCEKFNHKQSFAERSLRPSHAPADIMTLYNDKRHVTGYRAIIQS